MVSKTSARNATQKIPTIPINLKRTVSPHIFYTCPAGQKAVIKGRASCDGTGAAATVDLNAAGESIGEWQSVGGNTNDFVPQNMAVGVKLNFEVQLAAGETLDYSQNSGTNAEMLIIAEVQESPA